jgi:phytol kinase
MNQVKKRKILQREVLRKFIHLLMLPVLLGYTIVAALYGPKIGILALTALLIILLEIEYIRLEYKLKLPAVIDILRRKEKDNVAGNIFFVASTIICFAAFDYPIALLALLYTVFGDLMAALVGRRWGKTKIMRSKTVEGFIGGLIMNMLVGYVIMPGEWKIFLPMALVASIVELWTGKLDDNLTVPLAAGFVGQMLLFVWLTSLTSFPGPALTWVISLIPL